MSLIKLNNICVEYGRENKQRALNDVSMEIDDKEFVAVMGKSGCGKTTLLNVLGTLLKPQSGEYIFDGKPVLAKNSNELAEFRNENMGFVVQHFALVPDMSIYDNVALPLTYRKMSKSDVKNRVMAVLEELEIYDQKNKYPGELSGGQCQRAAIARALAVEPKVLICDEATSSLDVTIQKQIMELLEELKDTHGLSFIFICHNLALVQSFCDKVLVLYDGKVVESGKPDDIINEPKEAYTKKLVDAVFE